ncbi:MAG: NUDIX domain-containing protein [Kineosporiaceae bacterium]
MSGGGGSSFRDAFAPRKVLEHEIVYHGLVWDVVRDTVDLGEGGIVQREYVQHTGAVGILALDDDGRVLFVEQYRHPVGMTLWELPAGLLDVRGESPLRAAQRELAEEADVRAGRWDLLIDWFNSPGGMTEALRLYLARDLSPVPDAERHEREAEELGMQVRRVPLDEARDAVLGGALHNPGAVVGVLAACEARAQGWRTLRPADAPWPEHPASRDRARSEG